MGRKPNFEISFGFNSDTLTAVLIFTFRFLSGRSSPLFSLFLPLFVFLFAGHLVGLS